MVTEAARALDPCTDMANAAWFVERFGEHIRYVTTWKKWLAFDGKRFALDESGVMRLAMRAAEQRLAIALEMYCDAVKAADDSAETKKAIARALAYVGWAKRSQQAPKIEAMVRLARNAAAVAVDHTALDADPYLLNVANGTIDLRTGALKAHDPADLITKLAPVEYDPSAPAPTWDAFLRWAMQDDEELVAYLQRIVGYAAVGAIGEHILVFNYGDGNNGKGTTFNTIQRVLGDYAQPAPRTLLFTTNHSQHPTEIASLYGARFVMCPEVQQGVAFDEAKVKDLTGGDILSARRMGEDFWKFPPTHTLILAGNYKPTVVGDDKGIWRRIRVIPWGASVAPEDVDTSLPSKLEAEWQGILAWIVRGALEWQRTGLGDPLAVTEATAVYREESDPLGEFFALRCAFETEPKIARKMLRGVYEAFCEENGCKPIDAKTFAKRLKDRGVVDGGTIALFDKRLDAWKGVRLKTDTERSEGVGSSSDVPRLATKTNPSHRGRPEDVPTTSLPPFDDGTEAA